MALDNFSDKLTIKNILFTKALPNYIVPEATNGYQIFPCRDCGDKFLFQSSYDDHINRKSLKITFSCKYCNKIIISNNRCKFLSHIRSHSFKTTTINVSDLKIEPLPLQDINWTILPKSSTQEEILYPGQKPEQSSCYECKQIIERTKEIDEDRAKHYMKYTDMVYSCPICFFVLPNTCSLTAHLRIHMRIPPYYCPECGVHLSSKTIVYPYNHTCEGFNMIRATTRIKCRHGDCNKIFHPNDYKMHLKDHLQTNYKCVKCSAIWQKSPKRKHCSCKNDNKVITCLECRMCFRKLANRVQVNNHLNLHYNNTMQQDNLKAFIYPCRSCSLVCNEVSTLIKHQINEHAPNELKIQLLKILNEYPPIHNKTGFYRVIKKCDRCLRSFIYRCEYENIKILPNECPYKCFANNNENTLNNNETNENLPLVCYLCKRKISENWEDIKKHFSMFHETYKCIDVKVVLTRLDKSISLSRKKSKDCLSGIMKNVLKKNNICMKSKPNTGINELSTKTPAFQKDATVNIIRCNICKFECPDKECLETHIITHRDPCMAYQCLECGQCFVVKPSFSTHLLLEHGIANITEYIETKQCYNESALLKQPSNSNVEDEPIKENQCNICRDQFKNINELKKHFRVHGMAFLMKNKNNSP